MKRVALITGVAGGIGRATARVFANEGWYVVGVVHKQTKSIDGVRHVICADVSDAAGWRQICNEIRDQEGGMDALINNAGLQICKPLVETAPEQWDAVMATNVRSAYLGVRHAYPLMRVRGGSVVNVSSVHAIATSANIGAYAASKGALVALTRAMALELSGDNIRVNAVLPGAVDTAMLRAGFQRGHLKGKNLKAHIQELGIRHPVGRIGRPEEVAQAILFLADDQRSSFITAQTLVVDGGATARLSTE